MKLNKKLKNAYHRHSINQSMLDGKERIYYFEIENLQEDYKEMQNLIQKYLPLSFDFVASCLYGQPPNIRFFSKTFTGRFSIGNEISLIELKNKLTQDGYYFMPHESKSGPLCLNDDFSEPVSAKIFRLKLPLLEIKLWFQRNLKTKKLPFS